MVNFFFTASEKTKKSPFLEILYLGPTRPAKVLFRNMPVGSYFRRTTSKLLKRLPACLIK